MAVGGHRADGLRVAQARQKLGLTQADLAAQIGVHRVTLTKIENNDARTNVSLDLLERLADTLGRTREYLLGELELVDPVTEARGRLADALSKVADGMGEIADLVEVLNVRASDAAQRVAA